MVKQYIADMKKEFAGYNAAALLQDAMAGLTVAAVALPLALAFGVSSGADAAAGMITAIAAGIIIGLLGGASYQISGPTGAMAAILVGVAAKYGLRGVLTAGLLSGVILLLMAVFKVGQLVSFIPAPVITGFTSGIAVIIALGQVDNFFGTVSRGENALQKLASYAELGFAPNWTAVLFGLLAVAVMLLWPKKLGAVVPGSLAAIVVAVALNFALPGVSVAEVGAIPQKLISDESLLFTGLDMANIGDLIAPAVSIAALGMIESLLCGASAGRMKGERLNSTRELVAQGIGNVIIPLLGGIPATAAIARTSVVIKSGGRTRLASVFHSLVLVLSMFLLGGVMSRIPLAALAGVLMVTAWRMNEWHGIKRMFGKKMWHSVLQFAATMLATVVFDLAVAIVVGIAVAMLLFVLRSCGLKIVVSEVNDERLDAAAGTHQDVRVVYLTGPLFFGTQEQLTGALEDLHGLRGLILSMRGVPSVDDSALDELERVVETFRARGTTVLLCGVQPAVRESMAAAGFAEKAGEDSFAWDAIAALQKLDKAAEAAKA